jgi:hypothetical protein
MSVHTFEFTTDNLYSRGTVKITVSTSNAKVVVEGANAVVARYPFSISDGEVDFKRGNDDVLSFESVILSERSIETRLTREKGPWWRMLGPKLSVRSLKDSLIVALSGIGSKRHFENLGSLPLEGEFDEFALSFNDDPVVG